MLIAIVAKTDVGVNYKTAEMTPFIALLTPILLGWLCCADRLSSKDNSRLHIVR